MPERDPLDRQMFWLNLVGISLVVLLLGSFFWLYGNQFLSFAASVMRPAPPHPGIEGDR